MQRKPSQVIDNEVRMALRQCVSNLEDFGQVPANGLLGGLTFRSGIDFKIDLCCSIKT